MHQLGGAAIFLSTRDSQLGRGEPVEDAAQVISRMCDVVMIRTFDQAIIERFAANSRVPVINGLTNEYHPCQVLADIYTFVEQRGSIRGKTVAWIGDSNNVCNTWLQAAEVFDFNVHVSTPPGYEVEPERAGLYGTGHYEEFRDPMQAAKGAHLVTTDVWTSMGFEAENEARKRDFEDWQVDAEMMRVAKKDALFMHCLPAHRGEEVAAAVIDGPQSVVWEEAENRLHTQKALLEFLLLGKVTPEKPRKGRA
jgi:ornithine carbamoyltransferase